MSNVIMLKKEKLYENNIAAPAPFSSTKIKCGANKRTRRLKKYFDTILNEVRDQLM